jgi:hypothetical protein
VHEIGRLDVWDESALTAEGQRAFLQGFDNAIGSLTQAVQQIGLLMASYDETMSTIESEQVVGIGWTINGLVDLLLQLNGVREHVDDATVNSPSRSGCSSSTCAGFRLRAWVYPFDLSGRRTQRIRPRSTRGYLQLAAYCAGRAISLDVPATLSTRDSNLRNPAPSLASGETLAKSCHCNTPSTRQLRLSFKISTSILQTSDAWLGYARTPRPLQALREAVIEPAELAAAGQQPSSPIRPSTQIASPAKER